jgi:hypothetical protein
VLGACRVRYLRCPVDHLPSVPELQALVPQHPGATRAPHPAPTAPAPYPSSSLAGTIPSRRRERTTLWRDSGFFQDSFFAPESRREVGGDNPPGGRYDPLAGDDPLDEPNPGPVRH